MSNVTDCITLYLDDEAVPDQMFRRFIRDAAARDKIEHEATLTYWLNLRAARDELAAHKGAA